MKILLLSISLLSLSVLNGQVNFTTDKSFEETWTIVIDFFYKNGIPINTIDKSSGVIASTSYSFILNEDRRKKGEIKPGKLWTYQKKDLPENPVAWVMVKKTAKDLYPISITGDINILIKELSGKTTVSINLANLKSESNNTKDKWRFFQVFSTGAFEKSISDLVR